MLKIVSEKTDQKPNITHISRSSVLDRVQSFLPTLASENAKLAERQEKEGKDCCDIENSSENAGPMIEMDLALFERPEGGDSDSTSSDDEVEESGLKCACAEFECDCVLPSVLQPISPESLRLPAPVSKATGEHAKKSNKTQRQKPLIEEVTNGDNDKSDQQNDSRNLLHIREYCC